MAIYKIAKVREAMIGQWENALIQLVGMDQKCFNKRHQACPVCGGKDRWRYTDSKGREERGHGWSWCNSCGAMDGFKLFQHLYGEPFNVCVNVLGDWANAIPVEQRQAAAKKVASLPDYNYGKQASPELCRRLIDACYDEIGTPFTWEEGLRDRHLKVRYRGQVPDLDDDHYICETMHMVQADHVDPEPCNVAKIHPDAFDFLAGDVTFGAVSRMNPKLAGVIFLTCNWLDAASAVDELDCEVWACYISSNLDHVARRWKNKDRPLRVICAPDDFHTLCYAEQNGLKVHAIRCGNWAMGLDHVARNASQLLDELEAKKSQA